MPGEKVKFQIKLWDPVSVYQNWSVFQVCGFTPQSPQIIPLLQDRQACQKFDCITDAAGDTASLGRANACCRRCHQLRKKCYYPACQQGTKSPLVQIRIFPVGQKLPIRSSYISLHVNTTFLPLTISFWLYVGTTPHELICPKLVQHHPISY